MIPFNKPASINHELDFIQTVVTNGELCDNGTYVKLCQQWLEEKFNIPKVLLTTSCTSSLEMAAILFNISPGDEVIMPSYTFASTANAFILRGATIVFVDIRPDTLNINEQLIEAAITLKTRVIVVVHYAGVSCDMTVVMNIAKEHQLWVVEDAAQGVMSTYKGRSLGTFGHIGCFSFHETKNYTSGGKGGAILINDTSLIKRAEIIRDNGTDRNLFLCKQVDKYTWRDIGSSYSMTNLQAAYLWGQLKLVNIINKRRLILWQQYYAKLKLCHNVSLPFIPHECQHNAHMFYIKLSNTTERNIFIDYLKSANITSVFHYIPLHTSPISQRYSRFYGHDNFTTYESLRLVRLPLFYDLSDVEQQHIIDTIYNFCKIKYV